MSVLSQVPGSVALAVMTGGCLLVANPAFDDGTGSTGAATTTGPATTTTPTTGEPTPTSSATTAASDSGTSGTQTSEPVDPSTGPVGSTSTGTESTDDSTTDACAGDPGDLCETVAIAGVPYLVCEQGRAWADARAVCEARCARLVVLDEPESAAMFAALVARMTDTDKADAMTVDPGVQPEAQRASWWIGGQKINRTWTWLDGTPMPPGSQGGWASGNPDINGSDACAAIALFAKGGDNGKWFDRDCDAVPYRFVCETP